MMTGEDRGRHIVEAALTGLAQGALTLGLCIIVPLLSHRRTVTSWTTDTVWPTQGTDGLKALGVVDEGWHVYHGVSIAHWARTEHVPDTRRATRMSGNVVNA